MSDKKPTLDDPVEGQPQYGSCWTINNSQLRMAEFQPQSGTHPAACVQEKISKHLPTLITVPRSTEPQNCNDELAYETAALCTPQLKRKGWFLTRFAKPVLKTAYEGFSHRVFQGQLEARDIAGLRAKLALPRL